MLTNNDNNSKEVKKRKSHNFGLSIPPRGSFVCGVSRAWYVRMIQGCIPTLDVRYNVVLVGRGQKQTYQRLIFARFLNPLYLL